MFEPSLLSELPGGIEGVALSILIFAPVGISNVTPILANKVPRLNMWNTPMDFGKSWRGVRIFGDHKTWRGFITGTVIGTVAGTVLFSAISFSLGGEASYMNNVLLALALSAGSLLGDAVKSFFKRRSGVPSGKSWFPFDQLDYIVGGLVFSLPFGVPLIFALSVVPFYFGLHPASTYIGYLLKLKQDPI